MSKSSQAEGRRKVKYVFAFVRNHHPSTDSANSGLYQKACEVLEMHGMPCPMDRSERSWTYKHFDFIQSMVSPADAQGKQTMRKTKTQKKPKVLNTIPNEVKNVPLDEYFKTGGTITSPKKKKRDFVQTDEFLKSYEWRKVRMQAIKKYGAKCMCCGATPATGATMNVDHIKPRKYYPELALDLDNLQILCSPCNHGKGNWDETDWRPKASL